MKLKELQYDFPEDLIATEPKRPSRVLLVETNSKIKSDAEFDANICEISMKELLAKIPAGDVLVVNNTKVLKRRVFANSLEILFLSSSDKKNWKVLFPSKKYKIEDEIQLPLGRKMKLLKKGRPQEVLTDLSLDEDYFAQVAELPLPPYIQKMRSDRHTMKADESWYQTAWAQQPGSFAAPTASLHFSLQDIDQLKSRGVIVVELTLHVGLGTFLPVTVEDLNDHEMHAEYVEIPIQTWNAVFDAKKNGNKIWAMGTTVTRALESKNLGFYKENFCGFSNLLIQPGFKWTIVDRIITNFHQPESTLLALVAAFAGLKRVRQAYQIAIEKRFRLFSYGDLSVWIRE